jgi:putative membrane protein
MALLSSAETKQIEAAITRVERASASEIVVAVVEQSANYTGPRALLAFGWTLALALLGHVLFPALSAYWLIVLELPLGLLLYAFLGVSGLRRRLIGKRTAEAAVEARAFSLFAARGLHRTRERTGLLIFISELEHRVVILGDSGIHAVVGDQGWREHVERIVRRVREGRAAEGVVETIEVLEPLLIKVAPVREGDLNELPNSVVRE